MPLSFSVMWPLDKSPHTAAQLKSQMTELNPPKSNTFSNLSRAWDEKYIFFINFFFRDIVRNGIENGSVRNREREIDGREKDR